MPETKLLKVFLCYASEDKHAVRELFRQLTAENCLDVWLDVERLLPGQDWDLEIEKAVQEANIVLACISSRSVDKEGCIQKELRSILNVAEEKPEGTIFIIPVRLEDCAVPRRLRTWQWVDYFPDIERAQAYQRLVTGLKRRAENLGISLMNAKEISQAVALQTGVVTASEKNLLEIRSQNIINVPHPGTLRPEMHPHAFVIMPFGKKKGGDGSLYDFNAIYVQLIKPALEAAGFEAFRADEETTSSDRLTDMFQELLLADLCIVDMSIDNANVFYELGIRHAFRKRGIVHIQAGRAYMPFDIFNVRTIPYHITPEGVPDPAFLDTDKAAISRVTRDSWASDAEAIHSPIFNLLGGLAEPDRRTLRTPLATGFWREYNEWKERVTIAQRQKRIGDILLLTEEIRNPLIKEEALGEAGRALANIGHNELALSQYRKGLELNSRNLIFRREEAFNLNRLGRVDEAIVKLENLLNDIPKDIEAMAYLGGIYKEMWYDSWKWIKEDELRLQTAFDSYHWLIRALDIYLRAYQHDLHQTYLGVNALTLGTIIVQLADKFDDKTQPDPEITRIRYLLPDIRGGLRIALERQSDNESADYWTLIALAELRVLTTESVNQVTRAYRQALTTSRRNQFFLQTSFAQLEILQLLNVRNEFVQAALNVLSEEMSRIRKEDLPKNENSRKVEEKVQTQPAKDDRSLVFLFTGYMINHATKKGYQFPPERENEIRESINALLDKYSASRDDFAISPGLEAGSQIIFVECCVERGIPIQVYFAIEEAPYVRDFVAPCGEQWVERFYRLRNQPLVNDFYQLECVGLPKEDDNAYERNNRWALYSALVRGIDKLRLVAVWDGKSEQSKDLDAHLVKHMVELVRDTGGMIEQINPMKLPRQTLQSSQGVKPQNPSAKKNSSKGQTQKKK